MRASCCRPSLAYKLVYSSILVRVRAHSSHATRRDVVWYDTWTDSQIARQEDRQIMTPARLVRVNFRSTVPSCPCFTLTLIETVMGRIPPPSTAL